MYTTFKRKNVCCPPPPTEVTKNKTFSGAWRDALKIGRGGGHYAVIEDSEGDNYFLDGTGSGFRNKKQIFTK